MVKGKEKKGNITSPRKLIDDYENNLYRLEYFISSLLPITKQYDNIAKKELKAYKDKMREIMISVLKPIKNEVISERNKIDDKIIARMANHTVDKMREIDWSIINVKFFDQRLELLLKSSFVLLFTYFNYLFNDLLYYHYEKHPKALGEDLTLSYSEIRTCNDLNEVKNILIHRKIQSLLYMGFDKQLEFFKSDLNINIREEIIDWGLINEACQRRNIIVHNNGIVNHQYIKNVKPKDGDLVSKIGERLKVNGKYLLDIYMEIITGGIILIQNCWHKWSSDELEIADARLISSINKALSLREYEIAKRLGKYSKELNVSENKDRITIDILYCYSLKKLGDKKEFQRELKEIVRDDLSLKEQVSVSILKGDKKEFYENIAKAAKNGEIDKVEFNIFAIFREFEEDKDYYMKLEEAFK